MTILSFEFYLIVAVSFLFYWIFPSKYRWTVLLVTSVLMSWLLNGGSWTEFVMMYGMVLIAYIFGRLFTVSGESARLRKGLLLLFLLVEAGTMLFVKDAYFFRNLIAMREEPLIKEIIAPIGMSYFTLSLIGYGLDCYWNEKLVEKNPFKFALFGGYYPVLISGPIIRYRDTGDELTRNRSFSYQGVCFGVQRILWGLLKKLVLAERLSIIVDTIYEDPVTYGGIYICIGISAFLLQLYADFTGSMDVIYGVSELYGIRLPENFDLPFISRNLSEFWRRWHITLGSWLKNYIFFPIIKSGIFQSFSEKLIKCFGKNWGRKIAVWCALFFSWAVMGLWHGGTTKFFFVTLWFWFCIVVGEALSPLFNRIIALLKINTECFSWHLFQSIRTFVLVSISSGIFRAETLSGGLSMYKTVLTGKWNPWILFDVTTWANFGGLYFGDWIVMFFCLFLLLAAAMVDIVSTERTVREWIAGQNLLFRWIVWLVLFAVVVIWGKYGPEYNTADFIYKGF